jgi:hypothetical protein
MIFIYLRKKLILIIEGGTCYMVNNTETCFCEYDYSGDFCEIYGLTQLTVCQNKKCRLNLKRLFILINYFFKIKSLIGSFGGDNSCMVYNNEDTCFCREGYYGNSCEYNYQYDQNTNITISNCEKTNCLNGYLLYMFFFHLYFD